MSASATVDPSRDRELQDLKAFLAPGWGYVICDNTGFLFARAMLSDVLQQRSCFDLRIVAEPRRPTSTLVFDWALDATSERRDTNAG